jgi:hypothetical protein
MATLPDHLDFGPRMRPRSRSATTTASYLRKTRRRSGTTWALHAVLRSDV